MHKLTLKTFLKWVGAITVSICALVFAFSLVVFVFSAGVRAVFPEPNPFQPSEETSTSKLVEWAYSKSWSSSRYDGHPINPVEIESNAASRNSELIDSWIESCTSNLLSIPSIHQRVKAKFGVDGDHYANSASNRLTQETVLPVSRELRYLSSSLWMGRVNNAKTAEKSYASLQVATWLAIFLGFLTTVLVSLSSTEFGKGESRASRSIRILAIILPALGTATAAVTAFYTPSETFTRSSHALVSFRQIDDQMANELGALRCPTELESAEAMELADKLTSWKKLISDAKSVIDTASLSAVDSVSGPNKGQSGVDNGSQ